MNIFINTKNRNYLLEDIETEDGLFLCAGTVYVLGIPHRGDGREDKIEMNRDDFHIIVDNDRELNDLIDRKIAEYNPDPYDDITRECSRLQNNLQY